MEKRVKSMGKAAENYMPQRNTNSTSRTDLEDYIEQLIDQIRSFKDFGEEQETKAQDLESKTNHYQDFFKSIPVARGPTASQDSQQMVDPKWVQGLDIPRCAKPWKRPKRAAIAFDPIERDFAILSKNFMAASDFYKIDLPSYHFFNDYISVYGTRNSEGGWDLKARKRSKEKGGEEKLVTFAISDLGWDIVRRRIFGRMQKLHILTVTSSEFQRPEIAKSTPRFSRKVLSDSTNQSPSAAVSDLLLPQEERQKNSLRMLASDTVEDGFRNIPQANPDTLRWLFEHPTYTKWLGQHSGILGLRGVQGTGKSMALKGLLDQLQQDEEDVIHLHFSFWFLGTNNQSRRSRGEMYKTLLHQLLNRIPSAGETFWARAEDKLGSQSPSPRRYWLDYELKEMFLSALLVTCESVQVRIFVDSLEKDWEAWQVIEDFQEITSQVGHTQKGVNICFAGRYIPGFIVYSGLEIRLDKFNREGIQIFLDSSFSALQMLSCYPSYSGSADDLEDLKDAIAVKSSRFFLWADLAMESLREGIEKGDDYEASVNRVNASFKENMEEVCYDIVERIRYGESYIREEMISLVQWILFAGRPLTLEELRLALSSDATFMEDERRSQNSIIFEDDIAMLRFLENMTSGLAEVSDNNEIEYLAGSVVRFIDEGVIRFFSDSVAIDNLSSGSITNWKGESHAKLGSACYNFIKEGYRDWNDLGQSELEHVPFCGYAAEFWFVHVAEADANGISQDYLVQGLGPPTGTDGIYLLWQWARVYGSRRLLEKYLEPFPSLYDVARAFHIQSILDKL